MSARATAVANADREIEASKSRAIAARAAVETKPRTALEELAMRLQVQPDVVQKTLRATAFSACKTNEEFVALVIVANTYGLNPLLKEMYAFPAKGGGGIVPMVSVDGWIRIMNEHPAFDGIEFDYIQDAKGNIEAIEAVIYRKDRGHAVKVIEYLEECKRGTEPWRMMPRRMLRNRALIQGARIAFGFSGLVAEGDEDYIEPGQVQAASVPSKRSLSEELDDSIPALEGAKDESADEVPARAERGMSEVDEEIARQLDAGEEAIEAEIEEISEEEPVEEAAAGQEQGDSDPRADFLKSIRADIKGAKHLAQINIAEDKWLKNAAVYGDSEAGEVEGLLREKRKEIRAKEGGAR